MRAARRAQCQNHEALRGEKLTTKGRAASPPPLPLIVTCANDLNDLHATSSHRGAHRKEHAQDRCPCR